MCEKKEKDLFTFSPVVVPTCPPGVLIIWLWFDVGFKFLLLITHIHPSVPHYLLLGKKRKRQIQGDVTCRMG